MQPKTMVVFRLKPTVQIEHGQINLSMMPETARLLATVCQSANIQGLSEAEIAHLHTLASLFEAAQIAANAQRGCYG